MAKWLTANCNGWEFLSPQIKTLFLSEKLQIYSKNTYTYWTHNYVFHILQYVVLWYQIHFLHYVHFKHVFSQNLLNQKFHIISNNNTWKQLPNSIWTFSLKVLRSVSWSTKFLVILFRLLIWKYNKRKIYFKYKIYQKIFSKKKKILNQKYQ